MPSHKIHRLIDRLLLGREYPGVHMYLDEPYRILGPKHRVLRHDLLTVLAIASKDPVLGASALLHILADYGYSSLRRRLHRRGRGAGSWRRK